MTHSRILEGQLYVPVGMEPIDRTNSKFHQNLNNAGRLVTDLSLYESVAIPTKDFRIVSAGMDWLGPRNFMEALECKAIEFVHRDTDLAYKGNGGGLCSFKLMPPADGKPVPWWKEATWAQPDKAIELQLLHTQRRYGAKERNRIIDIVLRNTVAYVPEGDQFAERVRQSTYHDVTEGGLIPASAVGVDLNLLPMVEANQLRVRGMLGPDDHLGRLIEIGQFNLDIATADHLGGLDVGAVEHANAVLRSKAIRRGVSDEVIDQHLKLFEMHDVIDVGALVALGLIPAGEVWSVRQSKVGQKFREWMRVAEAKDSVELQKIFNAQEQLHRLRTSGPGLRILRFVVTEIAGLFHPVAGPAAGAADSFLAEKLVPGFPPRVFLERIRNLPNKKRRRGH